MILYLVVIVLCMIADIVLNIIFNTAKLGATPGTIVLSVVITTIVVIAIDGVIAFLVHKLPKKAINPFHRIYKINKNERKIYEKLGVRKWKDIIPELGILCNFRKNKINEPTNKEYIFKYIEECIYGEVCHFLSMILGFLIIFIYPLKFALYVGIPIAIVNVILNTMPTMALRYNRYKLMILYKRMEQSEARKNESTTHVA